MPPLGKGAAPSARGFGNLEDGRKLQVRIGIHTGLVVVGETGSGEKREILALGETPNLAARIQGQAAPDEVFISATTYHLVEGLFDCENRGQPELKGVATPLGHVSDMLIIPYKSCFSNGVERAGNNSATPPTSDTLSCHQRE